MKKLQLLLIPLLIFISCEEDPEPIDASLSDLYVSEELTYLGGNLSMELNTYNSSDKTIEVDIEIMLINKQEYDANYSNISYSSFKDNAGIIIKTLASESVPSGNSIITTTLTIPLSIDLGDYYILVALLFDDDDNETNNLVKRLITIRVAPFVFSDNFTVGNPFWSYTPYEAYFSVTNGVLVVNGQDDGFQHYAYLNIGDINFYTTVGAPFEFMTDVKYVNGEDFNYGIGIRYDNVRYFFFLDEDGYFKFSTYNQSNNNWTDIKIWTWNESITGNGEMKMLYNNSKMTLFFNDIELTSFDLQLMSIDRIYLYSQSQQTIEFDNVELYAD